MCTQLSDKNAEIRKRIQILGRSISRYAKGKQSRGNAGLNNLFAKPLFEVSGSNRSQG